MEKLAELKKALKAEADPAKAKILQRFFKTGKGEYGEGDKFLGVVVPKQRMLAKKFVDLKLIDIEKLLKSPVHEERLVALLILVYKYNLSLTLPSKGEETQKKIYKFYLAHTKYINNWDLVDLTAPKIVGAYLMDKDRVVLYRLAKSKNLWERRIAILATFQFIYFKDPTDALKISKILLFDSHDLIHKAVGWMLREVGKRCGEKYLCGFLDRYAGKMPRTMLRYAIERLEATKRQYYMGKKHVAYNMKLEA